MNPKSQVQRDKCREREIQKLHDQNGKFLLMMKKLKSSAQVKHTCTLLNLVIHLRTPISTRAHIMLHLVNFLVTREKQKNYAEL